MMAWLEHALERWGAWWRGDLRVVEMEGDTLPAEMPRRLLVHMVDGRMSWSAGLVCPCGCGEVIELLLLRSADPHWTLSIDRYDRPTLHPSVWKKVGCKSHFWLRKGRVIWVKPQQP